MQGMLYALLGFYAIPSKPYHSSNVISYKSIVFLLGLSNAHVDAD